MNAMDVNLRVSRFRTFRSRIVALTLAVATAGTVGYFAHSEVAAQDRTSQVSPADLSRTFVAVAKQIKPAVVSIEVREKARRTNSPGFEFPQIPGLPIPRQQPPRQQRGSGSGVIISPDGHILTNNHVAGDADKITVTLSDGRELTAKKVGADPETDLAVIKVDEGNLPFAKLGDSDRLEQGEWVVALGSPFGLQQTMTAGIVSATGRDLNLTRGGNFTHFIQTDASINPGNSGGPLINMQGEVVGINTLIFSQTGANVGVGFAIPANLASKVYAQLVKSGKVTRGYLGVLIRPVTPSVAHAVGFNGKDGALIQDVRETSGPAARAGLQSGDVIVEFDGKPVKSPNQLTEMVSDTPVGKAVRVKYAREGRINIATMVLAERPSPDAAGDEDRPGSEDDDIPDLPSLGISYQSVAPSLAQRMGLRSQTGAIIQAVQPGSPAEEAGLEAGDVIHQVGRTPVTNAQDLTTAIRAVQKEQEVVLKVERRSGQRSTRMLFVTVTLE